MIRSRKGRAGWKRTKNSSKERSEEEDDTKGRFYGEHALRNDVSLLSLPTLRS